MIEKEQDDVELLEIAAVGVFQSGRTIKNYAMNYGCGESSEGNKDSKRESGGGGVYLVD